MHTVWQWKPLKPQDKTHAHNSSAVPKLRSRLSPFRWTHWAAHQEAHADKRLSRADDNPMKTHGALIIAIGILGLFLGNWLTLLVTNVGVYAPTTFTGKSATSTMAMLSGSFARGSGPGFAGVFLIPVLFAMAYFIKYRNAAADSAASGLVGALAGIIVFYIAVTWFVSASFSTHIIPNVPTGYAPRKISGIGALTIAGLVSGGIALILALRGSIKNRPNLPDK